MSSDRRIIPDPRIFQNPEAVGALDEPAPLPIGAISARDESLAFGAATEQGVSGFRTAKFAAVPPIPGVARRIETIKGVDDNGIAICVVPSAVRVAACCCSWWDLQPRPTSFGGGSSSQATGWGLSAPASGTQLASWGRTLSPLVKIRLEAYFGPLRVPR